MKNMVMFILPSNQAHNQFFASSNFKTLHSVLESVTNCWHYYSFKGPASNSEPILTYNQAFLFTYELLLMQDYR